MFSGNGVASQFLNNIASKKEMLKIERFSIIVIRDKTRSISFHFKNQIIRDASS